MLFCVCSPVHRAPHRIRTSRAGRVRMYGSRSVTVRARRHSVDGRWTGWPTPVYSCCWTAVTVTGRFVRVSTKVFSRSIGDPWQQRRHWPQCDSYQENSRTWFFFPPSRSSTPLVCLSRCQMCPKQDCHPHFYSRDGCPILGIFASGTQSSPCRLPPKFPVPVPSSRPRSGHPSSSLTELAGPVSWRHLHQQDQHSTGIVFIHGYRKVCTFFHLFLGSVLTAFRLFFRPFSLLTISVTSIERF
jgi:hypothetical protein